MRNSLISANVFLVACVTVVLADSCSKKHDQEPLVITPTTTPLPYSTMVYLVTPTDKTFSPDYYRAAKACALSLQTYYKGQLGKTIVFNPVVVDTLTGSHPSNWYLSNNGPDISGTGTIYSYYNTKYDLQQLLGAKFDTAHFTYIAWVASDFPDETIPRGLASEGSGNLDGLLSKFPDAWKGAVGHALGHALGLPEPSVVNDQAIMSTGWPKYPNCVFTANEKDSLNISPFLQ